jgi:hypothetical protein
LQAANLTHSEAACVYKELQVLHVGNFISRSERNFSFKDLVLLYEKDKAHIDQSFVIENGDPDLTAHEVLNPLSKPAGDWYASFIYQNQQHLPTLLDALPVKTPPLFDEAVNHSECVWMFFGKHMPSPTIMRTHT